MRHILILAALFSTSSIVAQPMKGDISKCPVMHTSEATEKAEKVENPPVSGNGTSSTNWWPNSLDLGVLRQHSSLSNPMDKDFNYKDAFNSLDYAALKKDLKKVMTKEEEPV